MTPAAPPTQETAEQGPSPKVTSSEMIALDGVSKSYEEREVLHRLTLRVDEGQSLALVGPSGCGKSTLLRVMLGLVAPDEGTVKIGGAYLTRETAKAIRLRIGYVIQDGGLFPHLTARENVTLVPRRLNWQAGRVSARVDELFSLVGLPRESGERYPSELSGGQRQRVGLMRALVLDPDVLLMDEPLGALDPLLRTRMQRDLRALFRQLGKTVLMVTHDMAEAAFLADSIAVMNGGRIVQRGSFGDLSAAPADAFVAEFIAAQRSPEPSTSTR